MRTILTLTASVCISLCVLIFLYGQITQKVVPQAPIPTESPSAPVNPTPRAPLEIMVGSLFMVGHFAHTQQASTSALIQKQHVGGIVIMSAPPENAHIKEWTELWQSQSSTTLLIATDQEGGTVQRVTGQNISTTSQRELIDEDHAYTVAKRRGEELGALGITMNFAPVLDTAKNRDSFLYKRAFRTATTAHYFADAMIHGFEDAGVIAVPKHFPGHADTKDDSHVTLPHVSVSREAFPSFISPFSALLNYHPPKVLMTAHVLFPELDTLPATLSPFFLTKILRDQLHFEGVIVTDDMTMDAIDTTYRTEEATIRALEAGADVILFAAEPERAKSAIKAVLEAVHTGRLSEARIYESYARIQKLHSTLPR